MSEKTKQKGKGGCLQVLKVFGGLVVISVIFTFFTYESPEKEPVAQSQVISELDKKISDLSKTIKPQDYYILSSTDTSHATRSRYKTFVYSPSANTNDKLLLTASVVAMKVQLKQKVQYSSVVIFDSQEDGEPYLIVDYAPDMKGNKGEENTGSRFDVKWINKLPE